MGDERAGDWLTYREVGERLGVTAEVIRYRALRGKWPRRRGNDGRARVQMPEDARDVRTPGAQGARTPSARSVRTLGAPRVDAALSHALESHIKALQADNEALKQELAALAELAAEQARTTQASAALEAHVETLKAQLAAAEGRASEEADALREHNATLKADVEKLEALLATERERSDKAIAGLEAKLSTESERADRAIAAFASLAERLEAIAEARRPWWRLLLRRAG